MSCELYAVNSWLSHRCTAGVAQTCTIRVTTHNSYFASGFILVIRSPPACDWEFLRKCRSSRSRIIQMVWPFCLSHVQCCCNNASLTAKHAENINKSTPDTATMYNISNIYIWIYQTVIIKLPIFLEMRQISKYSVHPYVYIYINHRTFWQTRFIPYKWQRSPAQTVRFTRFGVRP